MEIPEGAKFIFFIVPVFVIAIIILFVLFSQRSMEPRTIPEPEQIIETVDADVEDFSEFNIQILEEGEGEGAQNRDEVTVHYTGTLINGIKFDSSLDRGEPFTFILGAGQVIEGWDEGVLGMKIGETRRLEIPSSMGYGEMGAGTIPGNAGLIFEVELLEINQ